jgi:photosystem II stability/assembly factor-like uncharacterized protein
MMLATIDPDGDVYVRYSPFYSKGGSWKSENKATSGGLCERPVVWRDRLTNLFYIAFGKQNGSAYDAYLMHSSDLGVTWSTPTLLMANSRYPAGAPSSDGDQIIIAIIYDSGTSGPAKMQYSYRGVGATSWTAFADVKDGSGTVVKIADKGNGNPAMGYAPHAPWTIWIVVDGETSPSQWMSTDLGASWSRLP